MAERLQQQTAVPGKGWQLLDHRLDWCQLENHRDMCQLEEESDSDPQKEGIKSCAHSQYSIVGWQSTLVVLQMVSHYGMENRNSQNL